MEETPQNGKELSHYAHANEMNIYIYIYNVVYVVFQNEPIDCEGLYL